MSVVGSKYAVALFDVVSENKVIEAVFVDYTEFIEILDSNKKFMSVLESPSVGNDEKKELLTKVFQDEMNGYLKNFLRLLIDKNRFEHVHEIYKDFRKQYFDYKNMVEATVVTVVPMEPELEEKLLKNLESRFNKKVFLTSKIDPSILGGAVVYVRDQVIDGSVRKQLDEIKRNINNIRLH
ncbi:MAG: F-type H+-transporting ATPase subunit delta [Eubacteriaceae bacterium]|nr:F-type H+-transporting ATPase subunit delta [Eubacteriaceae bacterium]MDK2962011.1 F-type H+-transporting ATPase subunit delta [Eubacteriaceae bacterium]